MNGIFQKFEKQWFSLHAFARYIVLPWIFVSALAYMVASYGEGSASETRRVSLVLFFSVYFVFVRCGLLVMTMNLHDSLKKDFGEHYAKHLGGRQNFGALGLKLGSTLARIKCQLISERQDKGERQIQAFKPKP